MVTLHINLHEITGLVPEHANLKNARVDFSPYRAYADDDAWVTRNILRVKAPLGVADPDMPPSPVGNAYEVQERGFRGARHGYVLVPDVAEVDYVDLVWVDRDTLDPTVPPSPAWLAALEALTETVDTAQETADSALTSAGAASAAATAAQADASSALLGLGSKVSTSTYTAGLATKADDAATTAALATKVNSATYISGLALKADASALTAEVATRSSDVAGINQALTTFVRFRDTDGNPIEGGLVTITVDTDTGSISDIIFEEV